jgi:hypothetical protein
MPISQVLRNAVWWTRIRPRDQDYFVPLPAHFPRAKPPQLTCAVGMWQGRPAYSVSVWASREFDSSNTRGATVQLWGEPPKSLRVIEKETDLIPDAVNTSRGRPVRPVFYHRCGLLEYVWFRHGAALPAVMYDCCLAHLESVKFDTHRNTRAIQLRQGSEVIGLVWPCSIVAPEVTASAQRQLNASYLGSATHPNFGRGPDP